MKGKEIMVWLPRILAILYMGMLLLFSLDVFSANTSILQMLGSLLVHNIPTMLAGIALWVAWKNERNGGYLFIILFVLMTLYFHTYSAWSSFVVVSLLPLLTGVLLLAKKR